MQEEYSTDKEFSQALIPVSQYHFTSNLNLCIIFVVNLEVIRVSVLAQPLCVYTYIETYIDDIVLSALLIIAVTNTAI